MLTNMLKLTTQATLIVLVIGMLAAWPCLHWSFSGGLVTMVASELLCLATTIISLIPMVMAVSRRADWLS